jgi:hypothetical protein
VHRIVVRLAAAALVAAAAGLGAAAPAQAATCATAHGVTVVVDFHQLGGGVQTACDTSGAGRTAITQLTDVGHSLTYVQRQPGFVCRIDGKPAGDPCVNTPPSDAYWSLWWSDGKSGTWTYASTGAGGLKVPDGGYVAMSWQGGDGRAAPGVAPRTHPSASPTPTHQPSGAPTHAASTDAPIPSSSSVDPSSSVSTSPRAHGGSGKHTRGSEKSPSPHSQSADPDDRSSATKGSDAAVPTEAGGPLDPVSGSSGDGGLPGWVAPAAVLLLFAAAGTVVVVRRRGSGGA